MELRLLSFQPAISAPQNRKDRYTFSKEETLNASATYSMPSGHLKRRPLVEPMTSSFAYPSRIIPFVSWCRQLALNDPRGLLQIGFATCSLNIAALFTHALLLRC